MLRLVLEAVVNVSDGRDTVAVRAIADAAGPALLDVHSDPWHHRSVLTIAGGFDDVAVAVRAVTAVAVASLDLRVHDGVHPRIGVVDVVPFVPLRAATMADARTARDRFSRWAADALGLPCFHYGPERSLPDVRRRAFRGLRPDTGPAAPHPTAGAVAVGARDVLVAWNAWLDETSTIEDAKRIARTVRGPELRTLGLDVGGRAQVSCNLVDPSSLDPADAYNAVVAAGGRVERCELVGLVPVAVMQRIPRSRWATLDLSEERTVEARLEEAGFDRSCDRIGATRTPPG